MFVGIVQGLVEVVSIDVGTRVSRISLKIPVQARTDLELGASVAVNGLLLNGCRYQRSRREI